MFLILTFIFPDNQTQNNKIRMAAPHTVVVNKTNGPVVYKRIRVQSSDSDDAATPAKKPIPQPAAAVELTTAVKERRFRNMLQMFPDISPMVSAFGYPN